MDDHLKAIVTGESIRYPGGPFRIEKRYMNGVMVGRVGHRYLACFNGRVRHTLAMQPVVGALNARSGQGWVWPCTSPVITTLDEWYAQLRRPGLLHWHRLLSTRLVKEPMVKLAIEDYSLDDLTILRDRTWFVGQSLRAPLWRVYALVPARLWENSQEFPVFDGQVRSVARFGAIYDPYVHKLQWR